MSVSDDCSNRKEKREHLKRLSGHLGIYKGKCLSVPRSISEDITVEH